MPHSDAHHPARPPDSPVDDSDSDLELDLEELDPQGIDAAQPGRVVEQRAPRIALRNLRMGGLRRGANRNGYGELGRSRDGGDEDAEALLRDGDADNSR